MPYPYYFSQVIGTFGSIVNKITSFSTAKAIRNNLKNARSLINTLHRQFDTRTCLNRDQLFKNFAFGFPARGGDSVLPVRDIRPSP